MAWYKLLRGNHCEGVEDNPDLPSLPDGTPRKRQKVYHSGDVFESDYELERLNGTLPSMRKFERLQTPEQVKAAQSASAGYYTSDTLEGMTVQELRDHADAEEIDLGGVTRKDQILERIQAAAAGV